MEIIYAAAMSPSQRSAAGHQWFSATYPKLTGNGTVRVSRYYPPGKKTWQRQHPTWAFEFPLKDLESANFVVTYCVCESQAGGSFLYCLGVPHQHVLNNRPGLYSRVDKSGGLSFSVFVSILRQSRRLFDCWPLKGA